MKRILKFSILLVLVSLIALSGVNSNEENLRQLTHCTPTGIDHPNTWVRATWVNSENTQYDYSFADRRKYAGGYYILRNLMKSRGVHSFVNIQDFRNNPAYLYVGTLTGIQQGLSSAPEDDVPAVHFEVYFDTNYYFWFIRTGDAINEGCTIRTFTNLHYDNIYTPEIEYGVNWGGYCYYVEYTDVENNVPGSADNFDWSIPRVENENLTQWTIEPGNTSYMPEHCQEIYNFQY